MWERNHTCPATVKDNPPTRELEACGAGGAADDEARLQDLDRRREGRAAETAEEEPCRAAPELERGLLDDGDRRVDHRHPRHVVEAHERDVVRNAQAAAAQHL